MKTKIFFYFSRENHIETLGENVELENNQSPLVLELEHVENVSSSLVLLGT